MTAGAATALVPLSQLFSRHALAREYGPLASDPEGRLDLPEGFSYEIIEQSGDPMDDGFNVPGALDGMACFEGPAGTLILMRNHEITTASGNLPDEVYTADSGGGVTRLVVDAATGQRVSSNWVLAGTRRNCAGGPSPWGWLTCEETTDPEHGYVFLTKIDAEEAAPPERIVGYGRYNHEAVAIDPETLYAYLTEDRGDGCLYRFVPTDKAQPFEGTLQALRVVTENEFPTEDMTVGDVVDIEWVDLTDPDPIGDTVRSEAKAAGAANVRRGEGIWLFEGEIYFASTSGGAQGFGQIFRLVDGQGGATLECVADSASADELNAPDNVTVAPWGQVFIAEDADGTCFLRALTEDGTVVPFARNANSGSELAGVCFSPDGKILFVNAQADGFTYAITGPFPEVPAGGDESGGSDGVDTGDSDSGGDGTGGVTGGDVGDGTTSRDPGTTASFDTGGSESSAGMDDDAGGGCACNTSSPTGVLAVAAVGVAVLGRGPRRNESNETPD
jgi:hypothetical protein